MAPSRPEQARTFARLHPALCLAPGLFVSKRKATRTGVGAIQTLARQDLGELTYVFDGTEPLGSDDLRVLQAVFLLASLPANRYEISVAAPQSPLGQTLAQALAVTLAPGQASQSKMLTCSVAGLAQAGGYAETAGGSREGVTDALGRLAQIRVTCLQGDTLVSAANLLACTALDPAAASFGEPTDTLALAIAPALSSTLLDGAKGRYVHIEQSDIDRLGDIEAHGGRIRLLHMRLCGFIDPGKQKKVSAETLAEYAFGPTESKDTRRRQLGDVRKALPLLGQLGWTVAADDRRGGRQVFTLTRPALQSVPAKNKADTR